MVTPTTTLVFPHPTLTAINGTPNLISVTNMRKQIYANARAIHSTRGGGINGHLAIVMANATYVARSGQAFVAPVHPGPPPVHNAGTTQAIITEANRQYDRSLAEHSLYIQVKEELKKQILQAVDNQYLKPLEDPDFGYSDTTPLEMLTHLMTTYGSVTPQDIEANRDKLSEPWNPDEPIESLWERITTVRYYAEQAQEPITEATALRLTIAMFEKTGVLQDAIDIWRRKPTAQQTLVNFKEHFTTENKERIRKITSKTAGYHEANAVAGQPATTQQQLPPNNSQNKTAAVVVDDIHFSYCWTHGLCRGKKHTSQTCRNPADGHQEDATITNMKGGCDRISQQRGRNNGKNQRKNGSA